jgi:hypothetical protein
MRRLLKTELEMKEVLMDERKRFYISCGLLLLLLLASVGYMKAKRGKPEIPPTEVAELRGGGVDLMRERNQGAPDSAVAESEKRISSKFSVTSPEVVQNTFDDNEVHIVELKGQYEESREAGKLFIVSGKIINRSWQTIEHIKVECSLHDRKGNEMDRIAVRPGKIIEYEEINDLSLIQSQNALSLWLPEEIEKFKINHADIIPFMLIFRKPHKDVFDFRVRCTR